MDTNMNINGKAKKGLIIKTWERCKSPSRFRRALMMRIRSSSRPHSGAAAPPDQEDKLGKKKGRVVPEGCFSVYVGPQKQRFVIKTEYANHPLFKILLEEAELEYGFNSEGPLALPCNVDLFYKVLVEMDSSGDDDEIRRSGCGFPMSPNSYRHLSSSRLVSMNNSNS